MSSCHLRHLSFRASAIPSFPSPSPLHGRTILPCMPSLSSSPAYIHIVLLEYHPTVLLKPYLCYRTRFFHKSSASPPSSSSYQRRDRCRHPTSHVFCIVRWSSRSPQRHPHPTLRWKRTSAWSHISSATFLPLLFTTPHVFADVLSSVPFFSRKIPFAVDTALVPAPLSRPSFTFFHIHHPTGPVPLRD